jgi:hypothetical protein
MLAPPRTVVRSEAGLYALERALRTTSVHGRFPGTAPAGFWAFVNDQWAVTEYGPECLDEAYRYGGS